MNLATYVAVLRRQLWLILSALVIGVGLAYALFSLTPPTYATTVQFYVSTPSPDGTNAQSTGLFAQARVNSYIELLSSEEFAKRVIAASGVDLSPQAVAQRITATADTNTVLLTATVADQSGDRSLAIARGVATAFGSMVDELDNQGRKTDLVVIHVVSGPTLNPVPVSPRLNLYLLTGLLLGLGAGVLYATLRAALDTKVRSPEDVVRLVDAPVLGTIPYEASVKRAPLIVGAEAMKPRAEAFRKIRTSLEYIGAAQNVDRILVTSALPDEGKTVSVANLALSMVEQGKKTLLIDADLRRSKLADYLDIHGEIGLSSVLAGQHDVSEATQEWGGNGLYVLASGPVPPNPAELLGSSRMGALMDELREHYDQIIVDAPPVLPVTDAIVAAKWVDSVLLVVGAGRTRRAQLKDAMSVLQTVMVPVAGVVVNLYRGDFAHGEYGGGYYGRTYGPSEPSRWARRWWPSGWQRTSGGPAAAPKGSAAVEEWSRPGGMKEDRSPSSADQPAGLF